ncbi:hypothetical protein ACFLKB_00450 [Clostridium sp. FAM 1755]|uniref:hypothetical protein n=1 Tax=Clostridium caseinilyticum TaxID=3350403 RepID=UPI0038F7350C
MFKLCFTLELGLFGKSLKNKIIVYLKAIMIYILPFFIIVFIKHKTNSMGLSLRTILIVLISIGLIVLIVIQRYIYKNFFENLDDDVVIKFIPNMQFRYIKIRIFIILVKYSFPFVLYTLFVLKSIIKTQHVLFYLIYAVIIINWYIINYLIAIYLRLIINKLKDRFLKIFKMFIFLICVFFTIMIPQYITILLLDELSVKLNNEIHIKYFNFNIFYIIGLSLVSIIIFTIFLFTNKYFKFNAKQLILNNYYDNKEFKINSIWNKIIEKIIKIIFLNLTKEEQKFLIKDLKELYRENKLLVFMMLIIILFTNVFMIYIFYNLNPKNILDCREVFVSIELVLLIFTVTQFIFTGFLGLRNDFKINKDLELIKKYNINFSKYNLIKIKKELANICLFYPICIFGIILLCINRNIYVLLGIAASIIPILIIQNFLSLKLIKIINKEIYESAFIKTFNIVTIGISFVLLNKIFNLEQYLSLKGSLMLWVLLNIILIINYLYNLKTLNTNYINSK